MKTFWMLLVRIHLISVLAGFSFQFTTAQIIYTDLHDTVLTYPPDIPGVTNSGTNYYYLDLDQNGVEDFYFSLHYFETWVTPTGDEMPTWVLRIQSDSLNHEIVIIEGSYFSLALTLFDDEIISNALSFSNMALIHDIGYSGSGQCVYFEGQSIGLKLVKNNQEFFGWIRMVAYCDANGYASYIRLIDCALNSQPGEPIKAGQKEVYFRLMENKKDEIHSQVQEGLLSVLLPGANHYEISIINSQGSVIDKAREESERYQYDISTLPAGMYLVSIRSGRQSWSLKFVKISN